MNKTVVLVGMMGAGKTALGRQLAQRLGMPFLDVDAEIEKATGMRIAHIFEEQGEPAFRTYERNKIAKLLAGEPCVLSTGGGAILDEITRTLIAEKAIVIWLKARIETLLGRVAKDKNRPLLKTDDPATRMRQLLEMRTPFYALAPIHIDTDLKPFEETVEAMVNAVQNYRTCP
ncbi:MAG: shikimate kinase [Alphaproteobacteria bacterium]|nr:shikimate kinase [Alphaproteobacteria bacterium]